MALSGTWMCPWSLGTTGQKTGGLAAVREGPGLGSGTQVQDRSYANNSAGLRAPAFCQTRAHIQHCPSAVAPESLPRRFTTLRLSLLVSGMGLTMSSDNAGRVNGMLSVQCLVQHLRCTYRRCSINGGSCRWQSRHDREPETRQEGRSEVLTWVRAGSSGSTFHGQERARTTPGKDGLCQEPPRSQSQGTAAPFTS